MSTAVQEDISEVTPLDAWALLEKDSQAILVDVRTRPEWSFVGVPDLSVLSDRLVLLEWRRYPDMSVAQEFANALLDKLRGSAPLTLLFICRSGARSMEAARLMSHTLTAEGVENSCVNVAEGFEGDLDSSGHRGKVNGWKARGLPWRQS